MAVSGLAQAEVRLGQLELQWGDPLPRAALSQQGGRFQATLLADDGQRYGLDPEQARRAAGDLYALAHRRVAVQFAQTPRPMQRQAGGLALDGPLARGIEAIVPVQRLPQRSTLAGAPMAAAAISGGSRWVTLMCRFSDDIAEPKPLSFFRAQYGNAPGQLGHYWQEVSYSKINIDGSDAYGWFALPKPRAAYISETNGEETAALSALFTDCAAAAEAAVDFTGIQGINLMFNGELDGFAWGGGSCATLEGVRKCPRVTWNPPWAFSNLGVLAHEMGHGYGLPHSDNSDGDGDTYDNPWDVLSDSWRNAVSDPTFGTLPKHLNMYQRERLGWVEEARKLWIPKENTSVLQVRLDVAGTPAAANKQLVILELPEQADPFASVVFTLEARKRMGSYEARLAGDAVIVHKLVAYGTARSVDANQPPATVSNNEGSMFKVGETWISPDQRHWVKVEQETATGFLLTIGPKPRIKSSPLPPRLQNAGAVANAPVQVQEPLPALPRLAAGCAPARQRLAPVWRCALR